MVSSNSTFYLGPLILLLCIFTYLTCSQLLYLSCVCFLFFHVTNMLYSSSLSSLFWIFINISWWRSWAQNENDCRESHRIGYFIVQCLLSQPPLLLFPKASVATMIYHEVFTVTSERQCSFLFSFIKDCKSQQNGTQPLRKSQHSATGISTFSASPSFLITVLT